MKKTLRKPKGKRARETQTLEGMSKSKVKVAIKKKKYPIKVMNIRPFLHVNLTNARI